MWTHLALEWTRMTNFECYLVEGMVGTTRFELATSPTPRVRSTRLSHVPTCLRQATRARGDRVV